MTQLLQYNTGRQIISIFSMQHSLHLVHKLHAFFFPIMQNPGKQPMPCGEKKNARVPWSPDQHRLVIPLPATYRAAFWISSPWKEPSSILIKGKNIFQNDVCFVERMNVFCCYLVPPVKQTSQHPFKLYRLLP